MTDKLYEFCLGKAREIFDAFIAGRDIEQEICYPSSCRVYRHYGAEKYDPDKVSSIKNRYDGFNKPYGGLWASDIKSIRPWKTWCQNEGFHTGTLDKYFEFQLKDTARVLRFENKEQVGQFLKNPQYKKYVEEKKLDNPWFSKDKCPIIDFEKIVEAFDAIEIMAGSDEKLYDAFYGWDCDSIVILNKEVIEPIEK